MDTRNLLYKPTNPIQVLKSDTGYYNNLRFRINGDDWELFGTSASNMCFSMGKIPRQEKKEEWNPRKYKVISQLYSSLCTGVSSWRNGTQIMSETITTQEFLSFWSDILKKVNPTYRSFNFTQMMHVQGMPAFRGEHVTSGCITVDKSGILKLESSNRGTKVKMKRLFFNQYYQLVVPLAYILKAIDADFGRFADPFDKVSHKDKEDKYTRIVSFHWEEPKEE